jgi:hypothetical protein
MPAIPISRKFIEGFNMEKLNLAISEQINPTKYVPDVVRDDGKRYSCWNGLADSV